MNTPQRILILNGPNLNLTGIREPEVYGNVTFDEFLKKLQAKYSVFDIHYFQTNHEGELIDKLHEVGFSYAYILLNAGGYTHTSVALRDAIAAISTPVIEVHISNPSTREEFRHMSLLSGVSLGVISGFGLASYELALEGIQLKSRA